jgi:hypothetical protein
MNDKFAKNVLLNLNLEKLLNPETHLIHLGAHKVSELRSPVFENQFTISLSSP